MEKLIEGFPNQMKRAMEIGEGIQLKNPKSPILNVLISGLGGSGIGGTIFSNIVKNELRIPLIVNKTYQAPAFVNKDTLVVIVSYSGDTEESLSVLKQTHQKGAKIVCICSGGEIESYAKNNQLDYVRIDGGMPPRAAFALSFVQLFYVFNTFKLINDTFRSDLIKATDLLFSKQDEIRDKAKGLAHHIHDTIPIIYTTSDCEGVAIRFKQQINENAKMLSWYNVIPEMNHNELVGWTKTNKNLSVIFLRNQNDYDRNQSRIDYVKSVINNFPATIHEVYSEGNSIIEKTAFFIHLCDWTSYFLSIENNVDSMEIDVITSLKNKLAEQPL